jgi:ferrous iron transport protein B
MKIPSKNKMAAVNPITERRCSTSHQGIVAMLPADRDNEKETNSWKWPLGQLILMSAFA